MSKYYVDYLQKTLPLKKAIKLYNYIVKTNPNELVKCSYMLASDCNVRKQFAIKRNTPVSDMVKKISRKLKQYDDNWLDSIKTILNTKLEDLLIFKTYDDKGVSGIFIHSAGSLYPDLAYLITQYYDTEESFKKLEEDVGIYFDSYNTFKEKSDNVL